MIKKQTKNHGNKIVVRSKKSKKFVLKPFTIPYRILQRLDYDFETISNLGHTMNTPKQNISYWLKELKNNDFVTQPKRGIYVITETGKNFLEALRQQSHKELVRLENLRYKYPIYLGLENLIPEVFSGRIQQLNNMRVYHGELEGHSYRIFAGRNNPSLEVTCPPRYGYAIYEMTYYARRDNETIAGMIAEHHGFRLGNAIQSMEPEWAIPSPLAEGILHHTQSSQIRTQLGTINRSKGRKADLETRDIRLASKILNLPNEVENLSNQISKFMTLMSGTNWNSYNSLFL